LYYFFTSLAAGSSLRFTEDPAKLWLLVVAGMINAGAWVSYGLAMKSDMPLATVLTIVGVGLPIFGFLIASDLLL